MRSAIGAACVIAVSLAAPTEGRAEGAKPPQTLPRTPECLNALCFTEATAVNDSGVVVGNRSGQGLRWADTIAPPQDIGSLGSGNVYPTSIDNLGRIVGAAGVAGGSHAFLWTAPTGMLDLGTLGGSVSRATDINDNGQVVGYSDTSDGQRHAFIWTGQGGMVDLGTLGGTFSSAAAINASGAVVGSATLAGGDTRAFLWTQVGGMIDLGTFGGPSSEAKDINASGVVIGASQQASGRWQSFRWIAGSMLDLTTDDDGSDSRAYAVNDAGQVVGAGTSGYSWTATGGLAALGSGGFSGGARVTDINNSGLIVGVGDTHVPRFGWLGSTPLSWQWTSDDLAVDIGAAGVWRLGAQGTTWTGIHNLNPMAMATGDVDGNGAADLVLDFGPGVGIWIRKNRDTWMPLHSSSGTRLAVGDMSGDRRAEVAVSFPGSGLWVWSEEMSWRHVSPFTASLLSVGGHALIATFANQGTWLLENLGWTRNDARDARAAVAGDIEADASGQNRYEYLLAIPGAGLWKYNRSRGAAQIHPFDVSQLAAGDLDGRGYDDLVIDFGSAWGLWTLHNSTTWAPLHPFPSTGLATADVDGLGRDEIIVNFGLPHGLWRYSSMTGWALLNDWHIDDVVTAVLH